MANQRSQKQKLLEILRLLEQETDSDHPIKCDEIIALLNQKGISAERKSVYSDLDILRQAGWDIRYQIKSGLLAAPALRPRAAETAQRRRRLTGYSLR